MYPSFSKRFTRSEQGDVVRFTNLASSTTGKRPLACKIRKISRSTRSRLIQQHPLTV
ncbi:Uncharacterised protein [Vibrio cholerae]|nr:Uncharacterised protein [Vibrio cholerae]